MEKPSVLIAEDNESTCTLLAALLRREFVTEFVMDGAEAIEKLRTRRYSVVLLDLVMPVVDGFGVLEFLRTEKPDLLARVVVVTAALGARQRSQLEQYPVAAVVSKPFELEVLHAAVARCAGHAWGPRVRGPLISGSMLLLLAELVRRAQ